MPVPSRSMVDLSIRQNRVEGDLDEDDPPNVGDVVQGYVIQTNRKGCFVRLARRIEGRCTIKEICDGFLPQPEVSFPMGRLVVGKVKNIREIKKASKSLKLDLKYQVDLDMRESTLVDQDQGSLSFDDIEVNGKYEGTVTRVESYGVFVRIENSKVSGLTHLSECGDGFIKKSLKALYDPGDLVKVMVIKKDPTAKQIGFSMKPSHFADDTDSDDDDDDEMAMDDGDESDNEEEADVDVKMVEKDDDDVDDDDLDSDDENFASKLAKKMHGDSDDEEEDNDDDDDEEVEEEDSDEDDESSDEESDLDVDSPNPTKSSTALDTNVGFDWGIGGSSSSATKNATKTKKDDSDSESSDSDESDDDDDDSDDDEEGGKSKSHSSRKKQAQRRREEEKIARREAALADGTADETPETAGDFERLLAGNPNSSELWIRYMSFHLSIADIESARAVAEKALSRIQFQEEGEKLNVWTALLTLELKYGNADAFEQTIDRACGHNNPKQVYLRVCEILEKDEKSMPLANEMYAKMCRKFKSKKTVWLAHLEYLLKQSRHSDAQALLKRALLSLPTYKHPETMSKFAQLEFEFGSAERARTVFDGILEKHKKRLDLFFVYLDKEVKFGTMDAARNRIEERIAQRKFSDKQIKSLFKKWFRLEADHGTEESQEHVKDAARKFVQESSA